MMTRSLKEYFQGAVAGRLRKTRNSRKLAKKQGQKDRFIEREKGYK